MLQLKPIYDWKISILLRVILFFWSIIFFFLKSEQTQAITEFLALVTASLLIEQHLLAGEVICAQGVSRGLTLHWCQGHQLDRGRQEVKRQQQGW
jgi:hypothetical protein